MNDILWNPSIERQQSSLLQQFANRLPTTLEDYNAIHKWSISNMEDFWASFWDFSGIKYSKNYASVLSGNSMPGARWFEGAELNYAENLLQGDSDAIVLVGVKESGAETSLTRGELRHLVARAQAGLKDLGVEKGSRVAAFVPNCVETVVMMLATSASGAIWTSCSPDFGSDGAVDRFGQVKPSVLITVDGYHYNGKVFNLDEKVNAVLAKIPEIEHVIRIEFAETGGSLNHDSVIDYGNLLENSSELPDYVQVPFDHPLYIMYSSGTTGPPKSIIHGVGGTLIQHLKEHQLQCDVQRDRDTLFWFTTCGWMMWNWLVSGLASGAKVVLYDGSPAYPDLGSLWKMAARTGITHFGTSPKFLAASAKENIIPREIADLSALVALLSTGSPLVPEQFDWIYSNINDDFQIASISGGTDIIGCFLGGAPLLPVRRGELQCAQLGMDVQSWDNDGRPVIGESGELICAKPFPSMPVGFWNDPDGSKYRSAYFEDFPGVWTHGDFVEMTTSGGAIIHGRSDTTLNPGGVRIGTAELYRAVENLPEVIDAIAVGRPVSGDVEVVLCLKLAEDIVLTPELADRVRSTIRATTTSRHVPEHIFEVADIPYTISGKKVEKAVLSMITGRPVKNRDVLSNPESLDEYSNLDFG